MRSTLLIIACLASGFTAGAQQTFLECGFTEGFPEGACFFDVDCNEPSIDMKNIGFDIGTPWIITQEKDGNYAACSTSWYKTPGKSNDWLVMPSTDIAAGTVLRWIGKAGDAEYRDGYSVYISENGNEPESFDTTHPAFSVTAEKAEWTSHEVSLEEYAGKTIYVAFVNDSKDKATLLIDDIFVGIPSCLEVESTISRVIEQPGKITVTGDVFNTSENDIQGFTVKYQFADGQIYAQEVNKSIKAGGRNSFRIESEQEILKNETLDYTLWVECNGDVASVSGKVSAYKRTIVAEEVTGTWCGYCVRGIAAMSDMNGKYGDSFLGIAVHASSVNWADPMEMQEYTDWLFSKFNMSGYPHATVNRSLTTTGDPGNIHSYYRTHAKEDNFTGLALSADVDVETRSLSATTTVYTSKDFDEVDFRLAYVVVENNVHGEGIEWAQNNYYADNAMGEMGGFESLPAIIMGDDIYYQDVARYISDFDGIKGSLPNVIKECEPVTHHYALTLPETIQNDSNAELAVLLINGKNGTILNAEVLPLKDMFSENGIEAMESNADLSVKRMGSMLDFYSATRIDKIELMTVDGRKVHSQAIGAQTAQIEMPVMDGILIVRVILENGRNIVKKIIR